MVPENMRDLICFDFGRGFRLLLTGTQRSPSFSMDGAFAGYEWLYQEVKIVLGTDIDRPRRDDPFVSETVRVADYKPL